MIPEYLSTDIFMKSTRKVEEQLCSLRNKSHPSTLTRSPKMCESLVSLVTQYLDESLSVAMYTEPRGLKTETTNSPCKVGQILGLFIFVVYRQNTIIFGNLRAFERK